MKGFQRRSAAILAVTAIALCVGASLLASADQPAGWELDTFRWANDLPGWLYGPLWPLMQYGALGAIPVAAAAALLMRRRRLAVGIASAGLVGYVSAKVVKRFVERGRPSDFLTDVEVREAFGAGSLGYPSGHAVVAATITTICLAHLPSAWRRAAVLLTAIVAFARIYNGGHLALDVIGGAALGVALGSLADLVGTHGPPARTVDDAH
jgi:membrane-associated phospholipid phosphatase